MEYLWWARRRETPHICKWRKDCRKLLYQEGCAGWVALWLPCPVNTRQLPELSPTFLHLKLNLQRGPKAACDPPAAAKPLQELGWSVDSRPEGMVSVSCSQ